MQVLCATIVAMARQMKMRTVAEGIEEGGEMETVQGLGCSMGQGYHSVGPCPSRILLSCCEPGPNG